MSQISPYSSLSEDIYSFRILPEQLTMLGKRPLHDLKLTRISSVLRRTVPAAKRNLIRVAVSLRELDEAKIEYRSSNGQILVKTLPPKLIRLNKDLMDLVLGVELAPKISAKVVFVADNARLVSLPWIVVTEHNRTVLNFSLPEDTRSATLRQTCPCGHTTMTTGVPGTGCGGCGRPLPMGFRSQGVKSALLAGELNQLALALIESELEAFMGLAQRWDELNESLKGRAPVGRYLARVGAL